MGVFLILVILVGFVAAQYFGNAAILYVAVGFAFITNVWAYWFSDSIAIRSVGAVPADEKQYIELHRIVENLAITAGLPKPRVYIINDPAPNAFATGRDKNHAVIAVTTGLLGMMNKSERRRGDCTRTLTCRESRHIGHDSSRRVSWIYFGPCKYVFENEYVWRR